MSRGWSAAWAAGLVGLVWVLLHLGWYAHHQLTDLGLYQHYGDSMVGSHTVPYRDFRPEYPPAALLTFLVPSYFTHLWDFRKAFQVEMFVCHVALVLAVLGIAGRRAAAFAAVAPLLLGSVVLSRFDLWPAALAALALLCLVRGRSAGSAVFLATAFAAKLWAGALGPLFLLWIWRREGRRRALEWLGATVAVAAAWFLPFVALGGSGGLGHMFHRQLARPLQIESLGSIVLATAHVVFGVHEAVVTNFGSQNLVGTGTSAAASIATTLEIVFVVGICALFARSDRTEAQLFAACAAVVAALIAFGKVFSPQFLIWLIPLVPVARRMPAAAAYAIALVLTQLYFPSRYWDLVDNFRGQVVAIVLIRDCAVVMLVLLLTYALARESAASSAPASSGVN